LEQAVIIVDEYSNVDLAVALLFARDGTPVVVLEHIPTLSDDFLSACVKQMAKEVYHDVDPVNLERRQHTYSEMGCNAGLAQPVINDQTGALTLRERWRSRKRDACASAVDMAG